MDKEKTANHRHLARLIRRIAKETANKVLDEHLDFYEHKEKPVEET